MSHSAGRSQSTALSVPPVSGSALDPFLGKHSPADEQGSDSDSGEASLEDLNNDLAYLRGRIEAVSKQRIKLLALLAPMNERPIEVRLPYKLAQPSLQGKLLRPFRSFSCAHSN